ncbi:hypothetical protein E2562_011419 [Oryza meyeriana var. granulata]|uniref:DUF4220 domain-containing protein n=1 Tax=Oryza meyeriana var. granulata TaxID=110450 RepID=A0A6G1D210_9ORYZ|nr:hypothetical protein E2562_011419 [Oryza meyeriana var. granulata]
MANTTGGEHSIIQIRSHGKGDKVAAPEKQLNRFVHLVAMIERLGNALGTLAFTWATVVLLGGYPTVLRSDDDFWFASTIVFLEAARMFSRENRMDYQLFFSTRGAFRRLGWNGLLTVMIPAAVVRVVLALERLVPQDYVESDRNAEQESMQNLKPSLNIFYGMVIGQGILYIVACVLEVFSFIPRRSLILRGGFRGQLGVKHVSLYYSYAFEKCMGGNVLAPKKISLVTFAMDSLNSDSSKKKLYGVQMLHSFLKKEHFRTKTIPKLTSSTETVASLFNMLGWTSDGDADGRLFAAKVTAQLADSLRVIAIPGAMQIVASLLDSDHQPKTLPEN